MKKLTYLLLLALLVFAGVAQAQDEEEVDTSEWQLVEGENTYLLAPEDWIDANDADALNEIMATLAEENPQFETTVAMLEPQIEAGLFDILLLEPLTGVSVNIVGQDLGTALDISTLLPLLEGQYDTLGATIVDSAEVELPAGDALQIHIELPLQMGGAENVSEQYQYILLEDTMMFVITLSAPQPLFEDFEPVFVAIAESFGIGEAPDKLRDRN